ncbi:MAG: hypothetical protein WCK05_11335, partial [Planctomycetota bacterium]
MESEIALILFLLIAVAGTVLVGGILGMVAMARVTALRKEVASIREAVAGLRGGPAAVAPRAPARAAAPPLPPVVPPPRPGESPLSGLEAALELAATRAPASAPPAPAEAPTPSGGVGQLESKIGRQWIAWVGAVVVFLSAALFFKHAFDNDWIGPTGQVIISALVSVGIHVVG